MRRVFPGAGVKFCFVKQRSGRYIFLYGVDKRLRVFHRTVDSVWYHSFDDAAVHGCNQHSAV